MGKMLHRQWGMSEGKQQKHEEQACRNQSEGMRGGAVDAEP